MDGVTISGVDDVVKKLHKLPVAIADRVLISAIRAAAKPLAQEAKQRVPVDTGRLKKSIGVVKRRSKDKNIVMFTVAPRKKKGGWTAHFIEFGTSKMAAKPFMRPAFESKGDEALEMAKKKLRQRVDKEIAKL